MSAGHSRKARWLAWAFAAAAVTSILFAAVVNLVDPLTPEGYLESVWLVSWVGFPIMGALIASNLPRNRLGWLLITTGVGIGVGIALSIVAFYGTRELALPWANWLALVANPLIIVGFVAVAFVILLFPDDELDRKWSRASVGAVSITGVLVLLELLAPTIDVEGQVQLSNPLPFASRAAGEIADRATVPLGFLLASFAFAAFVRSFLRFRQAKGVERLQRKWVVFAASLFPPFFLTGILLSNSDDFLGQVVVYLGFFIFLIGVPTAIAIAVLRYRLFDIDVVINKTLVYGSLAVSITVVYVGIVVGVGTLVGTGEEPSLILSILATSIVAVGFQPARRRLQRLANRIVFGERATPYEVLAGLSHQAADASGDVFGEVCRLLVEGTAAEWAAITRDGASESLAAWPNEPAPGSGESRTIIHEGEVMGELRYGITAGESLTSQQAEVLEHLTTALGLLLANTRLTDLLTEQVRELESSRSRIVAAGDEVRRRIETQLEEGPLQTLDEIYIRLADVHVPSAKGSKTASLFESVAGAIKEAKEAVVEFAQGVFPPVLAEHGLEGALQVRAETAPISVEISSTLNRRYPLEVEAALYFTASEALQNTIKYADASAAEIRLTGENGRLILRVSDDGAGFDPEQATKGAGTTNITERINALDGTVKITSAPGQGTDVVAVIPIPKEGAVSS